MFRKYATLTKLRWILMGLALLFSFNLAYASVVINEIMYAPEGTQSGREWVEIKNVGTDAVDFSEKIGTSYRWRLIKGNSDFPISPFNENSNILQSGGFAIIASNGDKFLQDYPSFSGLLLKSGFGSLNDSGDTLSFQDRTNDNILDTIDYTQYVDQANKNGNSLQLISGSWQAATPTPGQANQASSSSGSGDTASSNTTTSENSSTAVEPKPKTITNPTMKAKIVASNLVFAGQPFAMKTDISGFSNENVLLGRVYWNFGDGVSLEQINNFEKFYHIYHYPGDYVVLVEYYRNNFSETPDATAKMIIKVIPTTVTISRVGDVNDFFIELSNNASSDIDVSNWIISANGKTFKLPKNSVIISKKQMTISGKVTGFTYGDQFNLKLFSSTGEIVFDYAPAIIPPSSIKTASRQLAPVSATMQFKEELEEDEGVGDIEGENIFENLSASASLSDVVQENADNSYIPIVASFIFISTSAGAVYFIRQGRNVPKVGDDFKILDE